MGMIIDFKRIRLKYNIKREPQSHHESESKQDDEQDRIFIFVFYVSCFIDYKVSQKFFDV